MATRVQWMVYHEKGLWRDFPSELCIQTETLYQHNPVDRDVVYWWPPHVSSGTHYQIDFVAMQQTNLRTQFVRKIRRVTIHEALPEAVPGPSGMAPTEAVPATGTSSSADPAIGTTDNPIIIVGDVDMDGYELPEE